MASPSSSSSNLCSEDIQVNRAALTKYFQRHLGLIPEHYIMLDTSRITVIYFAVVGLDLLDELESIADMRENIIEYIYAQQLKGGTEGHRGFLGTYMGQPFGSCLCCVTPKATQCRMEGHLAIAYTALVVLKTLGDDFGRVDRASLVQGLFNSCLSPSS